MAMIPIFKRNQVPVYQVMMMRMLLSMLMDGVYRYVTMMNVLRDLYY
jgi:hypothetical protein